MTGLTMDQLALAISDTETEKWQLTEVAATKTKWGTLRIRATAEDDFGTVKVDFEMKASS